MSFRGPSCPIGRSPLLVGAGGVYGGLGDVVFFRGVWGDELTFAVFGGADRVVAEEGAIPNLGRLSQAVRPVVFPGFLARLSVEASILNLGRLSSFGGQAPVKITIFGATGALGSECLTQALDAGHEVTVLVRSASKLPADSRTRIEVVEGDGLNAGDVEQALGEGTEAILFAIGVDKHSPEDLCTDVTRHIVRAMVNSNIRRLVWCGGGSTLVEEDRVTFGARIVEKIAQIFMPLRHHDKEHQYQLLQQHPEIDWIGVRPLQMRKGPKRGRYRLGFDAFSGLSVISFADCAHAMVKMLEDDTWLSKAPIIQY